MFILPVVFVWYLLFVGSLATEPLCPDASVNISPCACTDGAFFCYALNSAEQLKSIFQKAFPANQYTSITVRDSALGKLPDNVFSDKQFRFMYFTNVTFSMPSSFTFQSTNSSLEKFYSNLNTIDIFNLDAFQGSISELHIVESSINWMKGNPHVPKLQTLSITETRLRRIPVLTRATSLEVLIVENTDIAVFQPNTFAHFPKLEVLDLSYNKLVGISDNWLNLNSDNLREVILANNQIAYIEMGALTGLHSSTTLDLSNNQLTTLQLQVFKPILGRSVAQRIIIDGNNLKCDCTMKWLFQELNLLEKIRGNGFCFIPGQANNLSFTAVDTSIFNDC